MAPRKSPLFDTATTLGKIMSFLGVSALCGVLAAGLIFPLAASGGAAAAAGSEMLEQLPAELREEPLSVPSHILAEDGTEIAQFYAENRKPVGIEDISQEMQDAIVAIEDERFYEHGGVDARGLGRAMVHNVTSDSQQGASTITQQYVNNVLINADFLRGEDRLTISGSKTYADKLREMKLSVSIEQEMTKDEILEGYLNIVLLGGRNYGVEAAAQAYWGVSAADLDVAQAATLAGIVQSPNGYNPLVNPDAAENRRNTVLSAMLRNDYITQEEYEDAVEVDLEESLDPNPESAGCFNASMANHFCDYVVELFLSSDAYGPDRASREQLLERGGLRITTTLDPDAQEAAEEETQNAVPAGDPSEAAAALVSVEPGTGEVKAMAQNTPYDTEQTGGTNVNYNTDFDYGSSGGFQGGSTLKPFVAAAWLEDGNSMGDKIDASVDEYPALESWEASCLDNGIARNTDRWPINNAIRDMKREMTVDYGLYWSINTATVATAHELDLCDITGLMNRVGYHSARDGSGLDPSHPSFVLGAQEVSPLTQASAFATLANDGEYCRPRAIAEVTDTNGNTYETPEADCEQVIDEEVVAQLNETLIRIAEDRTADGDPQFPMAGKTGTNNFESSTWFIGFSRGLSTASWVGNPNGVGEDYSLNGETIGGVFFDDVWGSIIAGPMWLDYMNQVAPNYSTDEFPEPEDSPWDDPESSDRYSWENDGTERGGGSSDSDDVPDIDDADGSDSDGSDSDDDGDDSDSDDD
ncbi:MULTISPECIES: transglycosylase domain-containing protein [unclassified Nesterenkonia]|uniref:transglycosylase domain-containing protein n=1 Tax=unclassified Nesterenkonia TaxID=2629769 RepID=UPI000A8C98D3|nr:MULTISPECIES: transglycosylase domain-containing protein [unclassified Nesterenkonia]MDS2171139.1 transglycosylase domain-containing protein [Nesterenkonia sp. CL21]